MDCIDESEVLTVADEGARMRPDFRHQNWEFLWKDQGKAWHKPWKNPWKTHGKPMFCDVLCIVDVFLHRSIMTQIEVFLTQDDRLSMVSRANSQTTSSSHSLRNVHRLAHLRQPCEQEQL